jgi:hypothetical protein
MSARLFNPVWRTRPMCAAGCALRRLCVAASVLTVGAAAAQDMMGVLLAPPVRAPVWRADARTHVFGRVEDEASGNDVDGAAYGLGVDYRLPLNPDAELLLGGGADRHTFRTAARLPGSDARVPETLWDMALRAGIKHRGAAGHRLGLLAAVSSPSDKPFDSMDEVVLAATAFYTVPAGDRDAWAFFLNYGNRRSVLNHVPLPGAAYIWLPRRGTMVMLGVPVVRARAAFGGGWEADGFFFPPLSGHLALAYALTPAVKPYVRFVSESDTFLRAGREDADAWLRHDVYHADAGVEFLPAKSLTVNASVGYVLARRLYEADSFALDDAAIEPDSGWLASISLSAAL